MDLEKIKLLITMLTDTDVTEIELEEGDLKLRIKRGINQVASSEVVRNFAASSLETQQTEVEKKEDKSKYEEIVAPIVGTFYRAPAPDAEPFVKKGDIVNPGDTLCIIEAMKLMNEIEVETRGKIVDILVENAQPVEYGEPLFLIEPL